MTSISIQNRPAIKPTPAGSGVKNVLAAVKETASEWAADNAMRLSASLSLYTILSLAPLLVVTLKIINVFWRTHDGARDLMTRQMVSLMGYQATDAINTMLSNGAKQGSGVTATIISTLVLFFSATGVFVELQDSMNLVWKVQAKPNQGIRSFIRARLLSLGMVFGVAFLLLVSMFITTVLSHLINAVAGGGGWVAIVIDIPVSFLVVTVLFAAIFKFLPDVKLAWRHVWLGAVITACLFIIGKYGLAAYFKYATPTSPFGAAGSLAAVLLWVYYSAFILFFGAEFTKVWSLRHKGSRIVPEDHAQRVQKTDTGGSKKLGASKPLAQPQPAKVSPRPHPVPISRPAAAAYVVAMTAIAGSLGASYLVGRRHGQENVPPEL